MCVVPCLTQPPGRHPMGEVAPASEAEPELTSGAASCPQSCSEAARPPPKPGSGSLFSHLPRRHSTTCLLPATKTILFFFFFFFYLFSTFFRFSTCLFLSHLLPQEVLPPCTSESLWLPCRGLEGGPASAAPLHGSIEAGSIFTIFLCLIEIIYKVLMAPF